MKPWVWGMRGILLLACIACFASCSQRRKAPQPTAESFFNSGLNKCQYGDYNGAVADFNRAIELNPTNADAYINRGEARSHLNDYSGAVADDTKAIELSPRYFTAYYARGNARLRQYALLE